MIVDCFAVAHTYICMHLSCLDCDLFENRGPVAFAFVSICLTQYMFNNRMF